MATATQVAEFGAAQRHIEGLITRDLRQLWAGLDLSNPAAARDLLLEVTPLLVVQYGQVAATVAADFFEDVASNTAVVPPVDHAAAAAGSTRWAVGPLWDGEAEKALDMLTAASTKHVAQYGRDTIHESTKRARGFVYARVPSGSDTCRFCIMLASRGGVYGSRQDAGGDGNKYHERCHCVPTPVRNDSDYPAGYSPDALYEKYAEMRDK
jgi:hypothetical protein